MVRKSKEELLAEQNGKTRAEGNKEPSDVDKANDELAITRANTEASAIRAGYPMPDPVEAWHLDIEAKNQKVADEAEANRLESEKLQTEREKLKEDSEALSKVIASNDQLKKEYEDGLAEIEQGKIKIASILENVTITAERELSEFHEHVASGLLGNAEAAAAILSVIHSSLVKRVECFYSCGDCHKINAKDPTRIASFTIPTLDLLTKWKNAVCLDADKEIWQLGGGFGVCGDCDPDQRDNRVLPTYLCDICPISLKAGEALTRLLVGFKMNHLKGELDSDGIYRPQFDTLPKDRKKFSPKEWASIILSEAHVSREDTKAQIEEVLGQLKTEADLSDKPEESLTDEDEESE